MPSEFIDRFHSFHNVEDFSISFHGIVQVLRKKGLRVLVDDVTWAITVYNKIIEENQSDFSRKFVDCKNQTRIKVSLKRILLESHKF
jgi:hypothetical protein